VDVESFRRIEEQKTRYVVGDRPFAGLSANFVGVDDEAVSHDGKRTPNRRRLPEAGSFGRARWLPEGPRSPRPADIGAMHDYQGTRRQCR